ncbi:MAG: nucleoside-triphosphatase [Clostridia bacterium]|nr:nucleoside-triphosphatase [Clostridia bacterium]
MKKNIFLTGQKQVGKSTLINGALSQNAFAVGGFKTLPHLTHGERDGFFIRSMLPDIVTSENILISRKNSHGGWEAIPATFEQVGVKILEESLKACPQLILMDELGFLENQALNFQRTVMKCLDSPVPILGVIKPVHTPFLDSVRSREDVEVLEITIENREEKYKILGDLLRMCQGDGSGDTPEFVSPESSP